MTILLAFTHSHVDPNLYETPVPIVLCFHTMEVNGYREMFGYLHSSKYLYFLVNRKIVIVVAELFHTQVVTSSPLTSIEWKKTMEVNGYRQLFDYIQSLKYLDFEFNRKIVNDGRIISPSSCFTMVPIDFHSMEKKTMEVNGYRQLFEHSSKSKVFFNV